jgi:hypothetical protein
MSGKKYLTDAYPIDSIQRYRITQKRITSSCGKIFIFLKADNTTIESDNTEEIGQRIIQFTSEITFCSPHHVCHLLKNNKSHTVNILINFDE